MKNLYKRCTENEEGAFLTQKTPNYKVYLPVLLNKKT